MHIQRQNQLSFVRIPPDSQVHLSVIPHKPPAHHADLLVRCLFVFLLPEDLRPEFHIRKPFKCFTTLVNSFQSATDTRNLAPFDRPVQTGVLVPVPAAHHVVVRLPVHLIEKPSAVPDNHGPTSPRQMRRKQRSDLNIGQRRLSSLHPFRKFPWEGNRVFLEIFRVVIFMCPCNERILYRRVHNPTNIGNCFENGMFGTLKLNSLSCRFTCTATLLYQLAGSCP